VSGITSVSVSVSVFRGGAKPIWTVIARNEMDDTMVLFELDERELVDLHAALTGAIVNHLQETK
jgi:hypothetical protein